MSNGVEVIVAGDKSTLPGNPLRILPSGLYKPHTLQPTTIQDHMLMLLPNDSQVKKKKKHFLFRCFLCLNLIDFIFLKQDNMTASLYPNQFVTKTCLTTYTYLKTYIRGGKPTVESLEKVISNIATEERNTIKITPTPTAGITLSQVSFS